MIMKFDHGEVDDWRAKLRTSAEGVAEVVDKMKNLPIEDASCQTWSEQEREMFEAIINHANKGLTIMKEDYEAIDNWLCASGLAVRESSNQNRNIFANCYNGMI